MKNNPHVYLTVIYNEKHYIYLIWAKFAQLVVIRMAPYL